ncbi:hypothetical protein DMC30DRAFT_418487 [Rhodotorula diobovata]|uniref:Proteophosphoglycan ppg4 n=1 Tax=Rhodotorula diobovata TaxID=5288 RepID=A0A5C5FR94_9BASI|nr:hypothetical protein DMC30DRAFT_418487 [Rhodotorula diobovata]
MTTGTHEEDLDPEDYHEDLHKVAQTCRALYHVAQPLRCRHLLLDDTFKLPAWSSDRDGKTTLVPAKQCSMKWTRFLHTRACADRLSPRLHPLLPLVPVRLSRLATFDLSLMAHIAGLRRLALCGCEVSASDADRLPSALDDLELLDLWFEPELVSKLLYSNLSLETVHLTPLYARSLRPWPHHVPGDALSSLELLQFLQFGPVPHANDALYEELIAPFVPQVASSLVFVFSTNYVTRWRVPAQVRRLVACHNAENIWPDPFRCPVPDRLADLVTCISQSDEVEVVALPLSWHPAQDLSNDNEGEIERGVRLGFNSSINACDAKGVELVWWAGPEREGSMPLCGEVRSGWSCALPPSADTREWSTPLEEWPGSWDALLFSDERWDEESNEDGDCEGEGSEEDEEDGAEEDESEEVDGDEEGAAGELEEDADL